MKIGRQKHRSSSISASSGTTILVRGHDLTQELMGKISFTEHFWLLLTGAAATAAQRAILDAALVAIAEHGIVPSVQASRLTLAAAPESFQGAVAAGILGCGSVILGSAEAAGQFLAEIAREAARSGDVEKAARAAIQSRRDAREPIPGYGHPLHKDFDPRARGLFALAEGLLENHTHVEIARTVARLLPPLLGKPLAINVSGAIPAVLLDAGYPLGALKGVPLLARTASLIAHLLEEQLKPIGFVIAQAGAAAVEYDGVRPEGFKESDD